MCRAAFSFSFGVDVAKTPRIIDSQRHGLRAVSLVESKFWNGGQSIIQHKSLKLETHFWMNPSHTGLTPAPWFFS
jgi:hypothetical protein